MKLHIIGAGVVGKATGSFFERFGHEVVYTDKGDDHAAVRAQLHFVCVPEAAAPEVVRSLCRKAGYVTVPTGANWSPGIPDTEGVVIRSSVPPGTTRELAAELHRAMLHHPEFLREATAAEDVVLAPGVVIGRAGWEQDDGEGLASWLAHLYFSCGKNSVIILSSTETELMKLVNNAYLSTQIAFWNEISEIAARCGINSHQLAAQMVKNDPRISRYGALMHGKPYGGRCLPKDMDQLLVVAAALDAPHDLLAAVRAYGEAT